jgi:hypothetical protein
MRPPALTRARTSWQSPGDPRAGSKVVERKEPAVAQRVGKVITADPKTVDVGAPVVEAARITADADVGAVVVVDGGTAPAR